MSRKYHSLLVRESKTEPWCIHFGDWELETVKQERDDIVDGEQYAKGNTKIITTGGTQAHIDAEVAKLNA
ncbi:hypothetical protein [Bradyrhizobium sp. Tv2a-2]|uniref:hypothetical protein n=1 Tax=Bradyrhizobium sp. Tv2a-2 TaxID=113395 RepID=UPI0004135EAA|nr:hypothetical protein [Bradyrhizobium sp. Tv2a-2]